ncbi:MAG: TetR/AcrR family transcriptional regulator [bacterium]|nr:TetR/AcrR family transcriptional regulator [bacterium]
MTTKEKIVSESLKLFSVNGFEAVSVRTIAANVGVRDSALYKHFPSKQAILDAIVEESKNLFYKKYKELLKKRMDNLPFDEVCLSMFHFQTGDEWIVSFRRLLMIEQFKNKKMAAIYKELFIDLPIDHQEALFQKLIKAGIMKDNNARVMAIELYAPFFLYHTVEEDEERLTKIFRIHVKNFADKYFNEYGIEKGNEYGSYVDQ